MINDRSNHTGHKSSSPFGSVSLEMVEQSRDVFERLLAVETVEVHGVGRVDADRNVVTEFRDISSAKSAELEKQKQ